jgi:phosphatidylserine/phosphatidylglycerophosphate/cardiolipin synthase-like enzyme
MTTTPAGKRQQRRRGTIVRPATEAPPPHRPSEWLLSRAERDNPFSDLDRHSAAPNEAWTTGNQVRPLVHGRAYFAELLAAIRQLRRGDLLLFTDWRGDADERLAGPGTEVANVLADAAARGVIVKGLLWRSHTSILNFSQRENRQLGEQIEAAGGESLLDTRVRFGGCHHQKFVVLRHTGRAHLDVAFVGGIDLCHGRNDDASHRGDPQAPPMGPDYGNRPPWHDVQVAISGPAVGAIETVFRERWTDRTPVTRNPWHRLRDRVKDLDPVGDLMPPQLPDPPRCGEHAVQLLRTYPFRRPGYPFAPHGERSVARGYRKAIAHARHLIYLEDQYLWSLEVADVFAEALATNPQLRLVAVVPRAPDQGNALVRVPQLLGRARALEVMHRAGGERIAVYSLENPHGTPVYVHAKVCIVDDTWAAVGSDNLNLRSWTYDSELSCAVIDETGRYARNLRESLNREHLGLAADDASDTTDPSDMFGTFARSADALDRWHAQGKIGPRPPGRLRRYQPTTLSRVTQLWATPLYRFICDPDGRPGRLRRHAQF